MSSVAALFIFAAFTSLQNLQSSLNADQGLGTICLSILYGAVCVGSLLIAPPLVGTLRPKWTLFVGFLCHLAFTGSNYYPRTFSLIPACFLLGAATGPLWASINTYLTTCSMRIAKIDGVDGEVVLQRYNGIFFTIFQSAQIIGNLISSLVFQFGGSENRNLSNISDVISCSSNGTSDSLEVSNSVKYILLSIFMGFQVAGVLLLVFGVKSLSRLGLGAKSFLCSGQNAFDFVKSVFKLHWQDHRLLLLIPITMYSGLEQAYIAGEYTKYFITDCLGITLIGYVIIVYGIVDAVTSFLCGRLAKHVGRLPIILSGATLNLALILFLLFWSRSPNRAILFSVAALWGIVDAVSNTQTVAMYGVLFTDKQEAAFGSYRFWQGIGFSLSFAYSDALKNSMSVKLGMLLGWLVLAILLYSFMEMIERRKGKQKKAFQ
ncbi:protein unc-93 homolog A-like isoform X2 [Oscarella lobularis]